MGTVNDSHENDDIALGQALFGGLSGHGTPNLYNEDDEENDELTPKINHTANSKKQSTFEPDILHIDKELLERYQTAAITNYRNIRSDEQNILRNTHKAVYTPPLISPRINMLGREIFSTVPEFADDASSMITYSVFDGSGVLVKVFYVFVLLCIISILAGTFLYLLMIAGVIYAICKLLGI